MKFDNGYGLVKMALAAAAGGLLTAPIAMAGTAPDAREPSQQLALVVFEGVPGSEALLHGDYVAGLRQSLEAYGRAPARHAFQLASNVCVARLKLGQLEAAEEHCSQVMDQSIDRRVGVVMTQRYQAVALVNHGVLLSAQGDDEGAGAQFAEARRKFPELGVARSNLEWVGGTPQVVVGDL